MTSNEMNKLLRGIPAKSESNEPEKPAGNAGAGNGVGKRATPQQPTFNEILRGNNILRPTDKG